MFNWFMCKIKLVAQFTLHTIASKAVKGPPHPRIKRSILSS